jgi:DNA-binding cell septation regulator SpoVG
MGTGWNVRSDCGWHKSRGRRENGLCNHFWKTSKTVAKDTERRMAEKALIEVVAIRRVETGKILAFADVKIRDLVARDFRLMKEHDRRPYVKVPFSTYKDSTGRLNFRPILILPDEVKGEIDLAILNAYRREKEKQNVQAKT